MKIDFMKNGMEIHLNDYRKFIPYQAIVSINNVKVRVNYANHDWFMQRFTEDNVEKYCSFFIILGDKLDEEIYLKKDIKRFPRLPDYSNWSAWKRFWVSGLNREGLSKEANDWLYHDVNKDMEEPLANCNALRDKIIEKFNEWNASNGKNKNEVL